MTHDRSRPEVVASGLTFPEGPRWRNGRLFFSDFYSHTVFALSEAGVLEEIATVPEQPSGLGGRIERVRVEIPGAGLP